jgi:UDP-N-acetylmuramate--alanine ligase
MQIVLWEVADMKKVLFIGIKGSGMSALAQILHDLGWIVLGEDVEQYIFTQTPLEMRNIPMYPFGKAPLEPDMSVIVSNAFNDDHPAVVRCKQFGLAIERYHHFLGNLMKQFTSIAVTGSHGKTTTTGMLSHALSAVAPTCSLIGDGTGKGEKDASFFVFESCEYKRHFLAYKPDIAVITNIDFDHPDYFADVDDVRHAFEEMAALVGKQLVVCGDDPQVRLLKTDKEPVRYGLAPDNDLTADEISVTRNGVSFDAFWREDHIGRFSIPVFGRHNVLNALAVIGTARVLGLNLDDIKTQMATFAGVKRRFSEKMWKDNVLIDDYAHHPNEIRATIEAVRSKYPDKKVVSVFQPHTFSRVEKFLDDFAVSLRGADDVFLCEIFGSARENHGKVTIEQLRERIPNAKLICENSMSSLSSYKDSVLLFMGAGDIQKYQNVLVES